MHFHNSRSCSICSCFVRNAFDFTRPIRSCISRSHLRRTNFSNRICRWSVAHHRRHVQSFSVTRFVYDDIRHCVSNARFSLLATVHCKSWHTAVFPMVNALKHLHRRQNIYDSASSLCRFVIPESPRWLLVKGRTSEVAAIIKHACIVNNREVPQNIEKILKPPPTKNQTTDSCISLFGTKYLRLITVCFLCIWFTMNLVYYGLILNMGEFGENVYLNTVSICMLIFPLLFLLIRCEIYTFACLQ